MPHQRYRRFAGPGCDPRTPRGLARADYLLLFVADDARRPFFPARGGASAARRAGSGTREVLSGAGITKESASARALDNDRLAAYNVAKPRVQHYGALIALQSKRLREVTVWKH